LQSIQSALAARVLARLQPVTRVEAALAAYRRAVEGQAVSEFASQHSLPKQNLAGDLVATAEALLAAVAALPELSRTDEARRGVGAQLEAPSGEAVVPAEPASTEADSSPESSLTAPPSQPQAVQPVDWGPLVRRVMGAPLVIVGGVARLERVSFAPRELRDAIEWIDTTRHGTHAIGNLAQRVKARRVGAVMMMEGLVGHRHSEPIVDAARAAGVLLVYAGKGGRNSIARAFLTLIERATADEEG